MLKDNLVMLRKLNGYSQEQVAEKIGISRQAYAKWESGATVPDVEKASRLAELYGVTVDGLLGTETADGVGVMTPTFYKADDAAMVEYYNEAAAAADGKPVYMYNIAKYTNNDISVKAYAEIVDSNPNVMGIKYSNSDISRIQDYLRTPKRRTDALIGADSLIVSALAAGCVGEVSGPACVFPKWYVGCYEAFVKGDHALALEYQNKIVACSRSIKAVPQIPAIKAMLHMLGVIDSDTCRRPFRKLTADEYRILENGMKMYAADC